MIVHLLSQHFLFWIPLNMKLELMQNFCIKSFEKFRIIIKIWSKLEYILSCYSEPSRLCSLKKKPKNHILYHCQIKGRILNIYSFLPDGLETLIIQWTIFLKFVGSHTVYRMYSYRRKNLIKNGWVPHM